MMLHHELTEREKISYIIGMSQNLVSMTSTNQNVSKEIKAKVVFDMAMELKGDLKLNITDLEISEITNQLAKFSYKFAQI